VAFAFTLSIPLIDPRFEACPCPLSALLDRYGFRGPAEIDFGRPRWREDPTPVLQTVRSNLASDEVGTHRKRFRRLVREAEAAGLRLEVAASRGRFGLVRRAVVSEAVVRRSPVPVTVVR